MSDFWSRRKAAVEAEVLEETALVEAEETAQAQAELEARSDAEILAELDLPDPDTLEAGDDVTRFLSDAVPNRIRTRALRRLWRLNPVLANVDGLVDYGEDFTDAATVIENLQTAYQVGKGMTEHVLAMARKAEEALAGETVEPAQEETPAEASEDLLADEVSEEAVPTEVAEAASEHVYETQEDDVAPAAPRRMRFVFDAPTDGAPA